MTWRKMRGILDGQARRRELRLCCKRGSGWRTESWGSFASDAVIHRHEFTQKCWFGWFGRRSPTLSGTGQWLLQKLRANLGHKAVLYRMNVMLGLGKDECRPCRIKGSSCNEGTGGHWRVFNIATWMEMLQGFRGSKRKCLLRSKVETCRNLEEVTRGSIGTRSTR